MIGLVDNGLCNIGSVVNMLNRLGVPSVIIPNGTAGWGGLCGLILPGVGNFGFGMDALKARGLDHFVREANERGLPLLGICLGMQLLAKSSEESDCEGLGLIDARVQRFDRKSALVRTVPNMGWAKTKFLRKSPLCQEQLTRQRFYFVHSYHVVCNSATDVLAVARNGEFEFTAAVSSGAVFGCQFHPEKSHSFGKAILSGYCNLAMNRNV